jgi:hypothetical protein
MTVSFRNLETLRRILRKLVSASFVPNYCLKTFKIRRLETKVLRRDRTGWDWSCIVLEFVS